MSEEDYTNRFKVRIEHDVFNRIINHSSNDLPKGIIELDAYLLHDEYWYHTNADKETIESLTSVELIN